MPAQLLSDIVALARDTAAGQNDDEIEDQYDVLQRTA
jgi:hypothetical protein